MQRRPRFPVFFVLTLTAFLFGVAPACAELVILTDGRFFKVTEYEAEDEQARLVFAHGGRMSLPIERVERVIDDEVIPAPEPAPQEQVAQAAEPPAPINLRFEDSQPIPDGPLGPMIYQAAKKHQLNPQVVAALIRQESAFNPRAKSHKGARGLMQLMPATAARFGVPKERLYQPEHNLEAGTRYLSWLIDKFPNDLAKVLAAYNAGENAVLRYQGIPPYKETRNYVRRIYSTLGLTIKEL